MTPPIRIPVSNWPGWVATLALHGGIVLILLLAPRAQIRPAPPLPNAVPIRLVALPPPPALAPEPAPAPIAKVERIIPVETPANRPQQPKQTEPLIASSSEPPAPAPPAMAPIGQRKTAAASLLFLPKVANQKKTGTAGVLAITRCSDRQERDKACEEYRKNIAQVRLAYGHGTMREGAAIGAKYRLQDEAELAAAFGVAPRYQGPPKPLKDSAMDTYVGSSDEMRARLAHWPPDPVFGD